MKRVLTVGSILLMTACAGSDPAVAPAPGVPSPVAGSVTVSSVNSMVFLGATEQMSATSRLSNGTTQTAAGTWGSDIPRVATINSSGLVTAMGSGDVTIFFDVMSGARETKQIRALPTYAGSWIGTYLVTTCLQSGTFVTENFCREYAEDLPFSFALTQSQDTVTGTFALGNVQFNRTTAPVAINGDLVFASTSTGPRPPSVSAVWTLNSAGPQQMTGEVTHSWTGAKTSDTATVTGFITFAGHRGLVQ